MPRPRSSRSAVGAIAAGAACLLLLTAAYLAALGGTAPAGVGGAFELTRDDGRAVTEQSLHGKFAVLYFGYTHCEDVCPATLAALASAVDELGPQADRVQPVFISVDPARDTPEVMRAYVAAVSPRLVGLTGTPAQLRDVERAYRVSAAARGPSIEHGSVLYLLGPDGRFIAPIRADETAPEIAAELRRRL
jgi:protein SCO1/2